MNVALHGTSLNNAYSIFREGYIPKYKVWTVSTSCAYGILHLTQTNITFADKFSKAMIQGMASASIDSIIHNIDIIPAVVIFNIDNKQYCNDTTNTFPLEYLPIEIHSKLYPKDIVGIYSIDHNLNKFRNILVKNNMQAVHFNRKLLSTISETTENINSTTKYGTIEFHRKIIKLYHNNTLDIPEEVCF